MTEDFRRAIISRGHDAKGPFVILACQHKDRRPNRRKTDTTETHRWCRVCEHRSPHR